MIDKGSFSITSTSYDVQISKRHTFQAANLNRPNSHRSSSSKVIRVVHSNFQCFGKISHLLFKKTNRKEVRRFNILISVAHMEGVSLAYSWQY